MKFTLTKEEIKEVLEKYVNGMFTEKKEIILTLGSKPKTGVFATVEVVEKKEEPIPKPQEKPQEEPTEEKKEEVNEVVTTGSIFSRMNP